MSEQKMRVEIWSDVMCPFCYIGKRRFEAAMEEFPANQNIEVIWKSFQLNPAMKTDPSMTINQYLAKHKGISVEQASQMNQYVSEMAAKVGLEYRLDQAVVANSFMAHRFSHIAKDSNKQLEAEEALFRAYFTEGKNLDDLDTLVQLGIEIGLDEVAVKVALANGSHAASVNQDILEAQQIGIQGVPFFVFDRKYAISGAQDITVFKQTLEKSYNEKVESRV